MQLYVVRTLGIALLCANLLLAQSGAGEKFDLTGMPARPTNFAEQSIQELVKEHRAGDLPDAARIQQKLAKYYAGKNDRARAVAAEERAEMAEAGGSSVPPVPPPSPGPGASGGGLLTTEACDARTPTFAGTPAAFTGLWYLYRGGSNEETWEFWGDSMFRHTWISAGYGTSVRTSERGRFHVAGGSITLHITSQTGASVSQSVGGHGSNLTGGTECKDATRRASFQVLGMSGADGIVLDGVKLKFRNR